MDYAKLLFALEIRDLAFKMLNADGFNFDTHPEKYPEYLNSALREATSTAKFIEKALAQQANNEPD